MSSIQVLLVDDNAGFLKSIALILSNYPHVTVVGEAHSGTEALEKNRDLAPNLILMDLMMPEMNGLDATRHIKGGKAPPRVIMLTFYDNAEYRKAARAAGADGFVAKSEISTRLCPLINELFQDKQDIIEAMCKTNRKAMQSHSSKG